MTRRTRRIGTIAGIVVGALFLVYIIFGFFGVPWITQSFVLPGISDYLHGQVTAKQVRFNPFTLRFEMDETEIMDPDDQPAIEVKHLAIDLSVSSIWRGGLTLSELLVDDPLVMVRLKPDGDTNIGELVEPAVDLWARVLRSPRLNVDRLELNSGAVDFTDETLTPEFNQRVDSIDLVLTDFSTNPDNDNAYSVSAKIGQDAELDWHGTVMLNPLTSRGKFTISDRKLEIYYPYIGRIIPSRLTGGQLSVQGSYEFSPMNEPRAVNVKLKTLSLKDVGLAPLKSEQDYFTLSLLEVDDVVLDVLNREVKVGGITLKESHTNASRTKQGQIDLLERIVPKMFSAQADASTNGKPATQTADDASSSKPKITLTSDGRPVVPPHIQEAQDRLRATLLAMVSASQATWDIQVGPIQWEAFSASLADHAMQQDVNLDVSKFQMKTKPTGTKENFVTPFTGSLVVGERGKIEMNGKLVPFQKLIDLKIAIDQLRIDPADAYLDTVLDATVTGELALHGKTTLQLQEDNAMQLTYQGDVGLSDFKVVKTGETEPRIGMDAMKVQDADLDLKALRLHIAALSLTHPRIVAAIDQQGRLDLFELLHDPDMKVQINTPDGGKATLDRQSADDVTMRDIPADLRVKQLTIEQGEAKVADRRREPDFDAHIDQLNVKLSDFSTKPDAQGKAIPTPFDIALRLDQQADITLNGSAVPLEQKVDTKINVKAFPLEKLNAFAVDFSNAMLAGQADVGGHAVGQWPIDESAQPTLRFDDGMLTLRDLAVRHRDADEALVKVWRLSMDDIEASLQNQKLSADQLVIAKPYVDLVLTKDGSINLMSLLKDDGKTDSGSSDAASAAKTSTSTGATPVMPEAQITEVNVKGGQIDVADQRLSPTFKTTVSELEATLHPMSTNPENETKIQASGRIAKSAPFSYQGHAYLMDPMANTAIDLQLKNFPMKTVDPYLTQYLARPAKGGDLTLNLKTDVKDSQLKGDMSASLKSFYLGPRVENPSDQAINLPVDVGLQLLRNSDDVVQLDVPLTGHIQNPGVDVTRIVVSAITNVLTNVVSAPFRIIGGLVGGNAKAEELQYILFKPGKVEPREDQDEKIDMLAQAMKKRPALKLGIEGFAVKPTDVMQLKRRKAIQQLIQERDGSKVEDGVAMSGPQVYRSWVRDEFKKMFPVAQSDESVDNGSGGEQVQTVKPTFTEMEKAVLHSIEVPESELQQLSHDRAEAVRQMLLQQGVSADRVTLVQNKGDTDTPVVPALQSTSVDGAEVTAVDNEPRAEFVIR